MTQVDGATTAPTLPQMASTTIPKFTYDDLTEERTLLSKGRAFVFKGRRSLSKRCLFRYLTLHPGRGDDPLACSLHTSRILDAPPYEAISYVWGSSELDHHIVCNDRSLSITKNLWMVLRRLRLEHAARVLWADSICINQVDIKEKGRQVGIMSDIYRSAACVLIYMGEDLGGHGQHVKSLTGEVSAMIDEVKKRIDTSAWDTFPYHDVVPFANDYRWNSLRTLLDQDWFKRGWVVREAALAQRGRVIWGQKSFSWEQLMLTLVWSYDRGRSHANIEEVVFQRVRAHFDAFTDQHIEELKCLSSGSNWIQNSLLDYLGASRGLQMSDPRDRLYAFADISTEEGPRVEVNPQYGETPLEVYHKFALEYIRARKDPKILDEVLHDAQTLGTGVPTWVPCWDYHVSRPESDRSRRVLTGRKSHPVKPTLVGSSILRVSGVLLERIHSATDVFNGPTTTVEQLANLWMKLQSVTSGHPYQASLLRAFFSCLTLGNRYGGGNFETWAQEQAILIQHLGEARNAVGGIVDGTANLENGDAHTWIKNVVHGRRFLTTSRGYIGLGPAVARAGDLCAIVFGCNSPCVLRPTSREGYVQFLGPCFLLGGQEYTSELIETYYGDVLGDDDSKDWLDWGVQEQDIYLV